MNLLGIWHKLSKRDKYYLYLCLREEGRILNNKHDPTMMFVSIEECLDALYDHMGCPKRSIVEELKTITRKLENVKHHQFGISANHRKTETQMNLLGVWPDLTNANKTYIAIALRVFGRNHEYQYLNARDIRLMFMDRSKCIECLAILESCESWHLEKPAVAAARIKLLSIGRQDAKQHR